MCKSNNIYTKEYVCKFVWNSDLASTFSDTINSVDISSQLVSAMECIDDSIDDALSMFVDALKKIRRMYEAKCLC